MNCIISPLLPFCAVRSACLIFIFSIFCAAPAKAQFSDREERKWWGALVYAYTDTVQESAPAEETLKKYLADLVRLGGYKQHKVVSAAFAPISFKEETWLLLGGGFFFKIEPPLSRGERPKTRFELYRHKGLLTEACARFCEGRPIIIMGPPHLNGRYILILELKPR